MTALSLTDTAQAVGLSSERFRKVWRKFVQRMAFPAPLTAPPVANYAWDEEAVAAWKARRSAAGLAPTPAANDTAPVVHPFDQIAPPLAVRENPRLERQRAELKRMIRRA